MRNKVLLFAGAFLLGYLALAAVGSRPAVTAATASPSAVRSTSARHEAQAFTEYEALMLDATEQDQLRLDQANTLNALLGLVEKKWSEGGYFVGSMGELARKLAERYPAQALRYYAAYPTNAQMNAQIFQNIRKEWAGMDPAACLADLDRDSTLSIPVFCDTWLHLLRDSSGQSADFTRSFASLSRDKQKVLISCFNRDDSIVAALVPVIKDPEVLAEAQQILQAAREQKQSAPAAKPYYQVERERIDAVVKELEAVKPEPTQVAKLLAAQKSEDHRRQILQAILEPAKEEKEDAAAWLARVSAVLAQVKDIPNDPPIQNGKNGFLHQKELVQWLPQQSPKLQRAWADDLISQKNEDEALEWIGKLGSASLRADLREQVMTKLIASNPQAAPEYIVTKGLVDEQENLLPQAVYQWALRDYAAARQWLSAQPDSPAKAAAVQRLEKKSAR